MRMYRITLWQQHNTIRTQAQQRISTQKPFSTLTPTFRDHLQSPASNLSQPGKIFAWFCNDDVHSQYKAMDEDVCEYVYERDCTRKCFDPLSQPPLTPTNIPAERTTSQKAAHNIDISTRHTKSNTQRNPLTTIHMKRELYREGHINNAEIKRNISNIYLP